MSCDVVGLRPCALYHYDAIFFACVTHNDTNIYFCSDILYSQNFMEILAQFLLESVIEKKLLLSKNVKVKRIEVFLIAHAMEGSN